ncbi:MAG: DUF2851 family protein [Crocinitomicaceae bacterium]|nr:DUF2851 family protein [Crocinitomicaceae bacterium]
MREEYLHYLFDSRKLGNEFETVNGQILRVIQFGKLNKGSGPDFLDAIVEYEDKTWAGNIEFHLRSSDWYKHQHQYDPAYNNVIAHFVLVDDDHGLKEYYDFPTIVLKEKIDQMDLTKIARFMSSKSNIICSKMLQNVNEDVLQTQFEFALEQRIQRKADEVIELIKELNGDRQKAFVILFAKALGGKTNAFAFTELAHKIELSTLAHLNYDPFKVEAYLQGLSGLLPEDSETPYVKSMIREFNYQKQLYLLHPLPKVIWKTFAYRPTSHPTLRIAQFASILTKYCHLSLPSEINEIDAFLSIELDPFWQTHFNFNRSCQTRKTSFSNQYKSHLFINVFIPYYTAIAKLRDDRSSFRSRMNHLKILPAEQNSIVNQWKDLGVNAHSAADSQGIIEQNNAFCLEKKCLFCMIGRNLIAS